MILNTIQFELDTYPIFYDIAEILMAMGVTYTNDSLEVGMTTRMLEPSNETVKLLEKYFDYMMLLGL